MIVSYLVAVLLRDILLKGKHTEICEVFTDSDANVLEVLYFHYTSEKLAVMRCAHVKTKYRITVTFPC